MSYNISGVTQGVAQVVTRFQEATATLKLDDKFKISAIKPDLTKTSATQGKELTSIVDNPLEKFASFSCLWTMACLTKQQFNDPRSYRNNPAELKHVIFSSAGRYDDQRVKTLFGSPEYFVNKFELSSNITPSVQAGVSNVSSFRIEIYEPYSMGLFLQSLQNAALNAGFPNYMSNTPFLIKLDIVGWDDEGYSYKGITSKYFPIRLRSSDFTVTESGSVYQLEAVPFNHIGFSANVNKISTDMAITGNTVKEILVSGERSMCRAINDAEEQLVKAGRKTFPDIYEVQFPSQQDQLLNFAAAPVYNRATSDPTQTTGTTVGAKPPEASDFGSNPIGASDMGFDASSGGNYVFKKDGDVRDEKTGKIVRGKMSIDPKLRTFQFKQGQSILNVITQTVMSCKYMVDNVAKNKLDPEGMVDWFKVDVQCQLLDFDNKIGDFRKKYIYRVLPYKTHSSIFMNPSTAPSGYNNIERRVVKKYEYIYTGQNNNVLNFEIKINKMFYTGIGVRPEGDTKQAADPNTNSATADGKEKTKVNEGPSEAAAGGNLGGKTLGPDYHNEGKMNSGSGDVSEQKKIAESFQNALLKGTTDLVNVEIDILGDPYWLVDSGMGNYLSTAVPGSPSTTVDGTMNPEVMDVHIYVTFRTPADIDETTGMYKFSKGALTSDFTGLYKVTRVEHTFQDGTFKQRLSLTRMPLQSNDLDGKPQPVNKTTALAIGTDKKVQPTAVVDYT